LTSNICDFCILIELLMRKGPLESYTEFLFKTHLKVAHQEGWQEEIIR